MTGAHIVAREVAGRRGIDLAPDAGESAPAFAGRVLDALSAQCVDLVSEPLKDRAESLYYGMDLHRDARGLRSAVVELVGLTNDITALIDVIPSDEATQL